MWVIIMINLSQHERDLLHAKNGKREISFRVDLLNRDEYKIDELQYLDGNIELNSLAQIKRRGNLIIKEDEFQKIDWLNDRVQVFFRIKDKDIWLDYSLGIFLISAPNQMDTREGIIRELEIYDSSIILKEDKFTNRYLIKKGTNYTEAILTILSNAGIKKAAIKHTDNSINNDKEFEIGTNKLEAINELLKEINYTSLWADEQGFLRADPYILPDYKTVDYYYKDDDMSVILESSSSRELDLFNVPNKWVVVTTSPDLEEPLVSTYTNDNPNSITSTVSRERVIVDHREINDISDQKTLDEYTKRIAYEASNIFGKFQFNTLIMPHHSYMNNLFCTNKKLGIAEKYTETSWKIDLKVGGVMQHNCRRVIEI